jgi:hypothetical protein
MQKGQKCPSYYEIRNNTIACPEYIIRTFSIYIRKITLPKVTVLHFHFFTFSLSLIPKSEPHKFVQSWNFLPKIITFDGLTNTKVKVSHDSLCMKVNWLVFFS